jgi:predicted Zn-dependent protease
MSDLVLLQAVDLGRLLAAANRGELRPVNDAPLRDYADAIYAWVVVACEECRWLDASVGVEHLASLEPDSSRRQRADLAVQLATGKAEASALSAQRLLKLAPEDAELHFFLGQSLGLTGRARDAHLSVKASRELAAQGKHRWAHVVDWCDQWLAVHGHAGDEGPRSAAAPI